MIYFDLQTSEDAFSAYLADEDTVKASILNGIHPPTIRRAISNRVKSKPILEVIATNGEKTITQNEPVGDILTWGVTRIFSNQAKALAISMGCLKEDFLACGLDMNPQEDFFMFLPEKIFDVVDVERSNFLNRIPVQNKEPILIRTQKLVLKDDLSDFEPMPHCFLAQMPGYLQSLGELFTSNHFKNAWEAAGFRGAQFRSLS